MKTKLKTTEYKLKISLNKSGNETILINNLYHTKVSNDKYVYILILDNYQTIGKENTIDTFNHAYFLIRLNYDLLENTTIRKKNNFFGKEFDSEEFKKHLIGNIKKDLNIARKTK